MNSKVALRQCKKVVRFFLLTLLAHTLFLFVLVRPSSYEFDTDSSGTILVSLFSILWLKIEKSLIPSALLTPLIWLTSTYRLNTLSVVCVIYFGSIFVGITLRTLIDPGSPILSHFYLGLLVGPITGLVTTYALLLNWPKLKPEDISGKLFTEPVQTVASIVSRIMKQDFDPRIFIVNPILGLIWGAIFFPLFGLAMNHELIPDVVPNANMIGAVLFLTTFVLLLAYALHDESEDNAWPINRILRECGYGRHEIFTSELAIPFDAELRDWDLCRLDQLPYLQRLSVHGRFLTPRFWYALPKELPVSEMRVNCNLMLLDADCMPKTLENLILDNNRRPYRGYYPYIDFSYRYDKRHYDNYNNLTEYFRDTLLANDYALKRLKIHSYWDSISTLSKEHFMQVLPSLQINTDNDCTEFRKKVTQEPQGGSYVYEP